MNKINSTAPDFIEQHPGIPWAQMRVMRNIAIDEYFFVDLGIVWTTVRNDFPPLKLEATLGEYLSALQDEDEPTP